MTETVSNPIATAERKSANILAYAVLVVGIYLAANAAFLAGGLFIVGSLILMPRFPFFGEVPTIVGWLLIAIAFTALP